MQKSGPRKDLLRLTLLNKRPPIFVSAAEEYALKTRHTEYISIMNTICFRCISYQKGLESIIFAVFRQILGKLISLAQGYKTRQYWIHKLVFPILFAKYIARLYLAMRIVK